VGNWGDFLWWVGVEVRGTRGIYGSDPARWWDWRFVFERWLGDGRMGFEREARRRTDPWDWEASDVIGAQGERPDR
jgi:hypothetical protein